MKISPLVKSRRDPVQNIAPNTCKGIGIMGGKKGKRLCGFNVNPISMRWKGVTCPVCISKKAEYRADMALSKAAIETDSDFPFDEEREFLSQMGYRD